MRPSALSLPERTRSRPLASRAIVTAWTNKGVATGVERTTTTRWPSDTTVYAPGEIAPSVACIRPRNRDQLWAEAFDRYTNGERWYADTPELRKLCEDEQTSRVQSDAWEGIVAHWLAHPLVRLEGDTLRATGKPFELPPDRCAGSRAHPLKN